MGNVLARGAGMQTTTQCMREMIGEYQLNKLIDKLPQDDQFNIRQPLLASWYSLASYGKLVQLYTEYRGYKSVSAAIPEFEKMGVRLAEDNLSFLYKVLLTFYSASDAVPMLSKTWDQYFKHHQIELRWDRKSPNATLCVRGLEDYFLLGPIAAGWMRYALAKTGAENATVVEETSYRLGLPASDELVFSIHW